MRPVLIILAACIIALAGCGRTPTTLDSSQVGMTEIPIEERMLAPSISGPSLASDQGINLADFTGQVTVMSSWASWCAPCITEMPILMELKGSYPDVQFLGLNTLDDQNNALQFVEDLKITFDSIQDPDGKLLARIPGVPPQALPSTIVLDKQGRIATRIIGEVKEGQLNKILNDLLRE